MSDPFSVAGSAVGVISLGLQVCQQLTSYCQAYNSYDEEIKKIGSRSESLQRPLKDLRELIEEARAKDPEIATDLADKALNLQSMVNSLRGTIDRMIPTMTANTQGKIRSQLNKVIYPFRRETLRDMLRDLDGIQVVLQTTLSIYSTQKISRLGLMHATILQEVQQIRLDLQHASKNRLMVPSLLKSWCDCHNECAQLTRESHMPSHVSLVVPRAANFDCSDIQCSSTQYQYFKSRYRNKSLVKSYKYLSAVLPIAVSLSFSMSTGAGGFSIAPVLSLQAIIKYEGSLPESMRQDRLGISRRISSSKFGDIIDTLICRLQRAFSEGQAAASNVFLEKGPFYHKHYSSFLELLDYWCFATCEEKLSSLRRLTRFLVDHGALPNNTHVRGPLRQLLMRDSFSEEDYSLVCYLVFRGGPLNYEDVGWLSPAERMNLKYFFFRDGQLIASTEAARIILQESEEELKAALESGRISPNEKFGCLSLLELAFGWPTGMRILLKSGSNVQGISLRFFCPCSIPDREHPTFDRWYHSYELLLDAGCKITCEDLSSTGSQKKLLSLFLNELTRRHRALGKLAISCLSEKELRAFKLHEQAVPDIHAPKICAELAIRGKLVDSSLFIEKNGESIYHSSSLSATIMEELFKAGFKDIDSPSSEGVTPIMIEDGFLRNIWMHIERLTWLVSKGADTKIKLPLSNTTVAHLISVKITVEVLFFVLFWEHSSPDNNLQLLDELISRNRDYLFPNSSFTDNCTCACSFDGCTTISVALRQTVFLMHMCSIHSPSFWFSRLLRCLAEWTQVGSEINRALIRFLTFDALGLKHTCCIEINGDFCFPSRGDVDKMISREQEEIVEILEEDKQGIKKLDRLVMDFEAKIEELGLPIWEFLEGYWYNYMVEHLSELDPYDEEHDQGTRGLGVILQEEHNPLDRVSLLIGAQIKEVELDVHGS